MKPMFPDKADSSIFVDAYLDDLSIFDKNEIKELATIAKNRLDNFNVGITNDDIKLLLSGKDENEEFIHDHNHNYDIDIDKEIDFEINGKVFLGKRKKSDTIDSYPLRQNNCTIKIGNHVEFSR